MGYPCFPLALSILAPKGQRLGLTSGFISVSIWIVVYTPQIWECYVLQSGEGLSVPFLIIWLIGDLTGLVGAIAQKLTLTISLLAVYYAFCDIVLLSLLFYYRHQRRTHPEKFAKPLSKPDSDECAPLLPNGDKEVQESSFMSWVRAHRVSIIAYSLATVFVIVIGIAAWFSSAERAKLPADPEDEEWSTIAQIFGWVSAFLYLGSRIPQIVKNTQTKCQGLSLMMFFFSVIGNLTYCGSILFPSTSSMHVWINFSWLVGSAGTILLDFIVLGQFFYYRKDRREHVYIEGGESHFSVEGSLRVKEQGVMCISRYSLLNMGICMATHEYTKNDDVRVVKPKVKRPPMV